MTMLAQKYHTTRLTSMLITVWGICLLLTTICTNYRQLYAQRFFLGLLEGPVSPIFTIICVSDATFGGAYCVHCATH